MSLQSLPITIRSTHACDLDTNINEICYTELRQLQLKLDANKDVIKDLAAVVPNTSWSNSKVTDMLRRDCPGEEFLHELSVLNKNLRDIIYYMERIEFWSGLEIFLEKFPPLLQLDLPKHIRVQQGQQLRLQCKAAGIPAPLYQWYYYPTHVAYKIEGETNPTLNLSQVDWLNGKTVICSICNVEDQIFTSPCLVQIINMAPPAVPLAPTPPSRNRVPPHIQRLNIEGAEEIEKLVAKDKVALLIGNGQYLSESELTAPSNDILSIGNRLKKMKFKTLICKDLSKDSMDNVLSFFITLLVDEGIYGVLYFAGHGFETNPGNCYLVPSDCPTQASPATCISSREVLNKILQKSPALCLVVLDICRVRKDDGGKPDARLPSNSSTMVVYATNEDKKAYEMAGDNSTSLFSKHLLKYIDESIPLIELMMHKVVPSISRDPLAKKYNQLAETATTLSTQRSLLDPIDHHGSTTKFQKSLREWESVNQRPELQEHDVPSLGVKIKIVFTHEYSNSLIIYIGCIKTDAKVAFKCCAHVSLIEPVTVVACATQIMDPEKWPKIGFYENAECMSVTKNVVDGIENLDSDLMIDVNIEGERQDGEPVTKVIKAINLKRPLLAKLNFDNRMRGHMAPLRVPVQHEENHAVEHDESFYEPVALQQASYMR